MGRLKDTGRDGPLRPVVESTLRSPTTDKEDVREPQSNEAEAPNSEAARSVASRQHWRPLQALLHLRAFETLRHREFRLLWLGQACTGMGTWMDQVTRGWLIYELTDSPVQLGLVRGVQAIPILLLSPLAGSIADRSHRKMQMLVAQVLDGLMYATLALLIITGEIQPWHVYATAFGAAIVQTFQQPARAAMVADAVPSSHLTNAIGLNAVIFNVARTIGPALVQIVIQTYSPPELRGRTMAIFQMSQVVLTLGSMLIGALASLWGARWAVASMAAAGALTMVAIYVALPRARLIR